MAVLEPMMLQVRVLRLIHMGLLYHTFSPYRWLMAEAWRGIFYFHPNDPALLVPKRFGIGYTLNFGNPWCWAVWL